MYFGWKLVALDEEDPVLSHLEVKQIADAAQSRLALTLACHRLLRFPLLPPPSQKEAQKA